MFVHIKYYIKTFINEYNEYFSSHSRDFHSYGDVNITGEGMQFLTYVRHLLPLGSEGSLARHNFCDTGHLLIMVRSSPRTRETHTYCRACCSGAVTTCFNDIGLLRLGFEHPTFRLRGERSIPLRHRRGCQLKYIIM